MWSKLDGEVEVLQGHVDVEEGIGGVVSQAEPRALAPHLSRLADLVDCLPECAVHFPKVLLCAGSLML